MPTVTIPDGALEFGDDDQFRELRTSGCKVVRFSTHEVRVFTLAGTTLAIRSATPIAVEATQAAHVEPL